MSTFENSSVCGKGIIFKCLIASTSVVNGEDSRNSLFKVLLVIMNISDKADTQILFNGVFQIPSLWIIHSLRITIITKLLSGVVV